MEGGEQRYAPVGAARVGSSGGGFVELLVTADMAVSSFLDLGEEESGRIMQFDGRQQQQQQLLGRYVPPLQQHPSFSGSPPAIGGLPYGTMLCFGRDGGVVIDEHPQSQRKTVGAAGGEATATTTSSSTTSSSSSNAGLCKPKEKAEEKRARPFGSGRAAKATAAAIAKKPRRSDQSSGANGVNNGSSGGTTKARNKQKLGDRIVALQQLVSPFGKSDTASVLHEALGYIRFLHEQVQVLSSPYLHQEQLQQQRLLPPPSSRQPLLQAMDSRLQQARSCDLRSRGLCLVPLSCTAHVADNNNGADLWSPATRTALGGGGGCGGGVGEVTRHQALGEIGSSPEGGQRGDTHP